MSALHPDHGVCVVNVVCSFHVLVMLMRPFMLYRLQNMLGKVVYQYSLLLAQQPSTLFLVPLYLCHLRQPQRESLLEILLVNATDVLDDEDCQMLYLQLLSATEGWHQRQERLRAVVVDEGKKPSPYWEVEAAEEGEPRQPSSCLFGDLRWASRGHAVAAVQGC